MAAPDGSVLWAGKRGARRMGGMADALSLAADLGLCAPPAQDEGGHNAMSNGSVQEDGTDPLIRVLRELTTIQRNLVALQVELQGRQEDHRVAHLTHASEIEKKSRALAKATSTLKDVIQNKDRIIARLQQPYSLDCIPVETEYQKQFSELLVKAAGDYGALSDSMADLQWSNNFKHPPSIWGELLRPIPAALASCTRYYEALSAMRRAVSELCEARTGGLADVGQVPWTPDASDSECVTPQGRETVILEEPSSDDILIRNRWRLSQQQSVDGEEWEETSPTDITVDGSKRRMSWPASPVTPGGPAPPSIAN